MPSHLELANAIRALAMDAVQTANSGHPGMPMGMADIAEVLWNDFLSHNPLDPSWPNRDRFILSNGHGSMLQYALLHLSGYDLTLEDLKQFRQLHSKTPGHPEVLDTPGVETTTGPLGQGLGHAVGMALAEKKLAAEYNRPKFDMVDHHTYVFCGDGCLMEGISHEVCSLAGTLKLGKLIAFYDDNQISIDGDVAGWFTDDTAKRFEAYGWQVIHDIDGQDSDAIAQAIIVAKADTDKPTLICCKTVIGQGAPTVAGTAGCHGAPLGEAEITATRRNLNWSYAPFEIPEPIYEAYDAREKGRDAQGQWQQQFIAYQNEYPELADTLLSRLSGDLPDTWEQDSKAFIEAVAAQGGDMATRKASKKCLDFFAPRVPGMFGGSADLTGSNCTLWEGATLLTPENPTGNYLQYGVREFGMSAIMCGLALHGGVVPFAGTFLTFLDYARNAVRLSALMKLRCIFVYTHDSIGLGEDGPTHQPVEHVGILRQTPNLNTWRPNDVVETAVAWAHALETRTTPSCLLLSRQTLPFVSRTAEQIEHIKRGGYILEDCEGTPEVILMSTGSECELALKAAKVLREQSIAVRVVSMPCTELFDAQSESYQASVFPKEVVHRVAIETSSSDVWYKYVGLSGKVLGMNQYGYSAPYKAVYETLGFTVENIVEISKNLIHKN